MLDLTSYERECGRRLDTWFATFAGVDGDGRSAMVFALLRRAIGGPDDSNPYRVEGAGWAGFHGFIAADSRVATFETLDDGCRAAAVVLHGERAPITSAYLTRDPFALAAALSSSALLARAQPFDVAMLAATLSERAA